MKSKFKTFDVEYDRNWDIFRNQSRVYDIKISVKIPLLLIWGMRSNGAGVEFYI